MDTIDLFLKQDWLESDKPILRYRLFSASQAVLMGWHAHVMDRLATWPHETMPRLLFDLSYPNASMSYFVLTGRDLYNAGVTPEGRGAFVRYLDQQPERIVSLAVLLSNTMLGALSAYKPQRIEQANFNCKIFFDEDAALDWLRVDHTLPDRSAQTNTITAGTRSLLLEDDTTLDDRDYYGDRDDLRLLVNGSLEIVPIAENRPVIVGRSPEADLDITSHGVIGRSVSRRHAQISLVNGRLTINDLDSLNGTRISGHLLEKGDVAFIRRGDVIRIGKIKLSVLF